MKQTIPYLNFNGNCREAMEFYAKCFGGELNIVTYSQFPSELRRPAEPGGEKIMHASLSKGKSFLMASDVMPGAPFQEGNNFAVSVDCESMEEIETLFTAIGENGQIKYPLHDSFWGARFGVLTDQFGINWMFNFEHPRTTA